MRDPIVETPPHLGGGEKQGHVDLPVLKYLVDRFGIRTMLDVGCGRGEMLRAAAEAGVLGSGVLYGVDGDASVDPQFLHDYTMGPLPDTGGWGLVWSMEFVEHVEEQFLPNILDTFRRGRVLFMTFAPPGKGGHHHVNCQPEAYWLATMRQDGWRFEREATADVRRLSDIVTVDAKTGERKRKGKRFTKDHGLVFSR